LNKSGNAAYTEIAHCDINTSCNVTGTGIVVNVNNNLNFLTVNNAAANVLVKAAKSCVAPVALAGTLNLVDSTVIAAAVQWVSGTTYAVGNLVYNAGATYARIVAGAGTTAPASDAVNWLVQAAFGASDTRNAITTAPYTVLTLANSQIITPTYDGVARVSLSGFYSIFNCVFDKPNSTLVAQTVSGGSTNSVDYFQYINADRLILASGGQITFPDGSAQTTAFTNTTVPILTSFYVSGYSLIQATGTPSNLKIFTVPSGRRFVAKVLMGVIGSATVNGNPITAPTLRVVNSTQSNTGMLGSWTPATATLVTSPVPGAHTALNTNNIIAQAGEDVSLRLITAAGGFSTLTVDTIVDGYFI
jgi:hypothetical protein